MVPRVLWCRNSFGGDASTEVMVILFLLLMRSDPPCTMKLGMLRVMNMLSNRPELA